MKDYIKLLNHLKSKCEEIQSPIEVNFHELLDRPATMKGINAGLNEYLEMKHSEHVDRVKNTYAIIDRIKIKRGYGFACPPKTMALFAHNSEFPVITGCIPHFVK